MKFTCSIIIEKPIQLVTQLFADENYLKEYQDGFLSKELITGIKGMKDAKSRMIYKMGKKGEMELIETIILNELPNEFIGHYHHKNMDNTMRCVFTSLDENRTQYVSEIEYLEFRGVMIKIMAFLFPSFFKNQVQKWLNNFKIFVENFEE